MSFQSIGNFSPKDVFRASFYLLVLWLSLGTLSFGQGDASIQGTVSDLSGGAIPAVTIKVKNLETGALRNLLTDEPERFDAASLPVCRYVTKAEKPGYRGEETTGISRVLADQETVDMVLQLGDVRQSVQVESAQTVVMIRTEDVSGL